MPRTRWSPSPRFHHVTAPVISRKDLGNPEALPSRQGIATEGLPGHVVIFR